VDGQWFIAGCEREWTHLNGNASSGRPDSLNSATCSKRAHKAGEWRDARRASGRRAYRLSARHGQWQPRPSATAALDRRICHALNSFWMRSQRRVIDSYLDGSPRMSACAVLYKKSSRTAALSPASARETHQGRHRHSAQDDAFKFLQCAFERITNAFERITNLFRTFQSIQTRRLARNGDGDLGASLAQTQVTRRRSSKTSCRARRTRSCVATRPSRSRSRASASASRRS
jgi:hypothetical protein